MGTVNHRKPGKAIDHTQGTVKAPQGKTTSLSRSGEKLQKDEKETSRTLRASWGMGNAKSPGPSRRGPE